METNNPGAAAAKLDDAKTTKATAPAGENKTSDSVSGFESFRSWANNRIQRKVAGPQLQHGELTYIVTELTPDGKLRLERGEQIVLVQFDDTYIPSLLEQLL